MTGTPYDVVLRGGRVIDPAEGLDATLDVGVRAGRIEMVAPSLRPDQAREIIDVRGRIVLPGMIDTHAHVYTYVTGRFGLQADMVGVRKRCRRPWSTRAVRRCMTCRASASSSPSRRRPACYAFVSAYVVGGLEGHYYPTSTGPTASTSPATVPRGAGQPRPDPRDQGACRARRRGALGLRGDAQGGRDRPRGRPAALHPFRPALGRCPVRRRTTSMPTTSCPRRGDPAAGRHPGPSLHAPSRRLRRPARQAASHRPRGDGARPPDRRRPRLPLLASTWRAARSTPASSPTRWAPTCTATTRDVPPPPGTPARASRRRRAHPFAGSARFSLSYAMTELLALRPLAPQVVPMVTPNAARMLGMEDELGSLRLGAVADVTVLADRSRPLLPQGQRRHGGDRRAHADAGVLPARGPPQRRRRRRSCRRRSPPERDGAARLAPGRARAI